MSTIPRLFAERVASSGDARAYSSFEGGAWRDYTWCEYDAEAREVGLGLTALGLARGETVAILGATRREWCATDLGAIGVGGVTVGLYPTLAPEGIGSMEYVLAHSKARVVFVESTAVLAKKLAPILARLTNVAHVIVWAHDVWDHDVRDHDVRDHDVRAHDVRAHDVRAHDAAAPALDARVRSYANLRALGRAAHQADPSAWRRAGEAARPEDVALLVYTSGTTGQPKGAMLTHGNVAAHTKMVAATLPITAGADSTVSFLPMAHVAERAVGHYNRVASGYATHFARSMETLLEDIGVARPTLFGSVPRIFEKVYAAVTGTLARHTGLKGVVGRAAFRAGLEAGRLRRAGKRVRGLTALLAKVFDQRVGAPLRARFGGRCGWFISGAAPIAVEILEFFDACGFKTYEVYGLSETTGLVTVNRPDALRYGTVGKALPGVELKLAADGEILTRGPHVFAGYFDDPKATAEAFRDGWFLTGDIGTLDADGFLTITDRKKNILITAGGKNITPSNIENEVKSSPLVSFCHLHADRRPYPVALVCLDPAQLEAFAKEHALSGRTTAELKDDPAVRAAVQAAIDRSNAKFSQVEQIRRFAILPAELSVEGGELTPTLKLKRREVDEKYAATLDALYEPRR